MRRCVWALVLVSATAIADDDLGIRVRRLPEKTQDEPFLHLDPTMLDLEDPGALVDGKQAALDLGPRARLAAEGRWWQSGLAPSMFATDLDANGWRMAAELSYDLGPFRVGVNASMSRFGEASHRKVGLFAYRTFRLSRWTRLWIVFGIAFDRFEDARGTTRGPSIGLAIGGTFR